MKTQPAFSKTRHSHLVSRCLQQPGFALIVTLSLMILLTVVAVGLLSLATISLRASSQSGAMSTARANARVALILAIGDLQKYAGADQRITARADVDPQNTANPRLTGVWNSWNISATNPPSPGDYDQSERDSKFLGWLASSPDGQAASQIGYARSATTSPVTLWGKGSLGTAPSTEYVRAATIPTSPSRGALAWAVMDEGVKVRIDTPYVDSATTRGIQTAQLGSGERPNTASIPTLGALRTEFFEHQSPEFPIISKGITRLNFELAAEGLAAGTGELLKPLTHDMTTSSVGLFTDAASGGLKEDLNLLLNSATLPTPYNGGAGNGVYATRLGMSAASAPSDPGWEAFQQLGQMYRNSSRLVSSGGVPVVKAQAPAGWSAVKSGTIPAGQSVINNKPPAGLVMMPTLAKVQMMFSLVGRDLYPNLPANINGRLTAQQKANNMHGPQDSHFRSTKFDYDLHLLSTPIVTLHNPYNVAIEFTRLRVEFLHVPFAMKIFRNGQAQSTDFVPLETMYGDNRTGSMDKIFGMNIKEKNLNPTVRMLPGEVKIFTPFIDPARSYQTDLGDRKFWDIYVGTGLTNNIDAVPGWRGDGIGFDCDNVTGGFALPEAWRDGSEQHGLWQACIGMAWDDQIAVEFVPKNIPRANNKFVVRMAAAIGNTTSTSVVSALEFNYENPDGLKTFLGDHGAEMPMRYPKADASPNFVRGIDLVDRASTPIGKLQRVKPFALLSVQAKTTSGARDASNEDGRLATKPWSFAHANIAASTQKVISEHSANFSHEIDLQSLDGSSANYFSVDPQDRSNFITGNTSFNGTKFGAQYDIPLTPLQTLVGLNSANPGGSTIYLPRFAHPIGNSWAHPLMDPTQMAFTPPGAGYPYLDHSFLLNLALYDRYYFSGFADQTGSFGSGRTVTTLVNDFIAGNKTLADPRMTLHTPDGKPATELATEITGTSPHRRVAAWQLMNGAFNINSTSVAAWKAMLGSIHDSQAIFNRINKVGSNSAFTKLPATDSGSKEARLSRFRLPASESEADGADSRDAYWLGPRELSDDELETLAENIVKQVQERGPFLSMAEFVNRRLGPASDEKAQRGALQQAIDDSDLNNALATGANAGFEIPESAVDSYKYANPRAGAGASYQGAPGYLSQADLLAVLGNAATPRSDTFTIRGYGEARDASNKIIASAVCEAVVQRVPEYIDAADRVETAPLDLISTANKTFGRRFQIVSFRWLNTGDI